jgi:microcystin degradation protein MlrC
MLQARGDSSALGGVLEVAHDYGWAVVPSLNAHASPSATVSDKVIDFWWQHFERALQEALRAPLDAVYLVLHGAMVSQSYLDVEGEMLRRIRETVGTGVLLAGVHRLACQLFAANG